MSKTKVIVIPSDKDQPVRWDEYDHSDYRNLTALVFDGKRDGTYSMSTVGDSDRHVSLFFDDEGLFRLEAGEELPDIINLRAMQLWADLDHVSINDFSVPLIGTYVVVGDSDEDGNSMDAPAWVMDYPFTWHQKYVVRQRHNVRTKEGE